MFLLHYPPQWCDQVSVSIRVNFILVIEKVGYDVWKYNDDIDLDIDEVKKRKRKKTSCACYLNGNNSIFALCCKILAWNDFLQTCRLIMSAVIKLD